tara:strand:- start:822 stop:1436 length:615 start_codon:yes stop_codon:yes gene_type:complete
MAQNIPITSYTNGFFATDVVDDPQLLDEVPFVSNAIGKNIATASGFDTLSSGSNPNDTDSAIIGIHSTPAYGNQWGTQHTIGGPGLSAMGVLWKTDASLQKTDPSSGLSRTTRVIHLSTPNRATPHTNHRNTTICTFISAAVDLAVVYRNGFTATYTLTAGNDNINAAGNGYTGHGGLSATGNAYSVETNVGPNIRRLVALGYR